MNNLFSRYGFALALVLTALCTTPAAVIASDMKLEAVLVWGTNDGTLADPSLKPITEDIAKKMNCLPFKYTNYFEVNRKNLVLPQGGTQKAKLSKDCSITLKSLDEGKVELTLMGKGQPACKITQELKKGKCLVTGGHAENSTAWFVVIKQID